MKCKEIFFIDILSKAFLIFTNIISMKYKNKKKSVCFDKLDKMIKKNISHQNITELSIRNCSCVIDKVCGPRNKGNKREIGLCEINFVLLPINLFSTLLVCLPLSLNHSKLFLIVSSSSPANSPQCQIHSSVICVRHKEKHLHTNPFLNRNH